MDLHTGRQLLGRPPFGSLEPAGGDLDEQSWSERWRGGWQTCFPNYGRECVAGGVRHGFHGRASNDPWTVADTGERAATLRWRGHGIRAEKRIVAGSSERGGCELRVEMTLEAEEEGAPAVALEHVTLGLELIEPELALELPAGRASELDAELGPVRPPPNAPAWPAVALLGGGGERGDRWALRDERSRLFVVCDLPEGRARVANPGRAARGWSSNGTSRGCRTWSSSHEARGRRGCGAGRRSCCASSLLGSARGRARCGDRLGRRLGASPGEPISWWTTLRSLP